MVPANKYLFQKNQRLLSQAAFSRVFQKARRSRDKCFTVLARQNKGGPARLGLAISKKHCRKATDRNRQKRLIRESFRRHQEMLRGLDVVVLNQPAATMADKRSLTTSLEAHWRRLVKQEKASNKRP